MSSAPGSSGLPLPPWPDGQTLDGWGEESESPQQTTSLSLNPHRAPPRWCLESPSWTLGALSTQHEILPGESRPKDLWDTPSEAAWKESLARGRRGWVGPAPDPAACSPPGEACHDRTQEAVLEGSEHLPSTSPHPEGSARACSPGEVR